MRPLSLGAPGGLLGPLGRAIPAAGVRLRSRAWETASLMGWHGNRSYVPPLQKLLGANYVVLNEGRSGATALKNGDVPYDESER